MQVNVINQQTSLKINLKAVQELANEVVSYENRHFDEVAINFVKVKKICSLHKRFFQDPSPTDCISFPMDANDEGIGYRMMGEIFVCPEVALEYAVNHQKDPYHELMLYVVHGLLHLMGYDDLEPAARRDMRAAEKRHLKNLEKTGIKLAG